MNRSIVAKYLASKKVICEILDKSENIMIGYDGGNNLNRSIKEFHVSGFHIERNEYFTFTISLLEIPQSSGKALALEIQQSLYSLHSIQEEFKFKKLYLNSLVGIISDNCAENFGSQKGVIVELEKLRKKEYEDIFKTNTSVYTKLIDIGCIDHICNLFIKKYSTECLKSKNYKSFNQNKNLKSLYTIKNLCDILKEDSIFLSSFYQQYKKQAPIPDINEIRFNSYLTGAEFIIQYWDFIQIQIAYYKYNKYTSDQLNFIYQYLDDPIIIFEIVMFSNLSNLITRPLMRDLNQPKTIQEYFKILNTFNNDKIDELEQIMKNSSIFKNNSIHQSIYIECINILKESVRQKIEEYASKKDFLNNQTLENMEKVKFVSYSNRASERKQGSIKRYLLKHKDMKLIVLEALIGLQQVNQLFHYNDLPLLEQQRYLQEARRLYDDGDTRFDRFKAKAKVMQEKMKDNLSKKLKEENEKPVLEFLKKNNLIVNLKDPNKPTKTLTIQIMKDSLNEMINKKKFVPNDYRLPKNVQKKEFYLQEIKKVIPK